jgi:hypothetical protein
MKLKRSALLLRETKFVVTRSPDDANGWQFTSDADEAAVRTVVMKPP